MYGYCGKILNIDLKGKVWTEGLSKAIIHGYLGGRGINAKLLWDYVKPGIDPLGPDNVIIFGAGVLCGTAAPSCGRIVVTTKSPLTSIYCKGSAGGGLVHEMKFAGYDHIVIHGSSSKPVYIWIEDDMVEIKDASDIWGRDVRETDTILKERHGEDIHTAIIGQAGENLVKFAGIMIDVHNAVGRCGVGTVLGSKRLKAITVKGTGSINVKEQEPFDELVREIREKLSEDPMAKGLFQYGTAGIVRGLNENYSLPSYNFKKNHVEDVYGITGQCLVEKEYLKRRIGCESCSVSCHRFVRVSSGKYAGAYTGGPEYEAFSALGSGTGTTDTSSVIKANELCNVYGLDVISTGSVIQWAMECYEKNVITKDDVGFELRWGDGDALVKMVEMIAFRKGIGNVLAEGVKRASQKIGKDSWKWAVQAKGLEQSRCDTRIAKGYALAFAVNPRGPDHLHTECAAESGGSSEAEALIEKITGDAKYATPHTIEKRAEIVRWHEDCYAVSEILGICVFANTWAYAVNPENMAQMFSLATGMALSEEEMMRYGRKVVTLEKCFNIREGLSRKDDTLPWRMMNEPVAEGPFEGMVTSKAELDEMLDRYYTLHEWDTKTSWPYKETLNKLGLREMALELEKLGRLPKHK